MEFNEFTASSINELRVWSARTKALLPYARHTGVRATFSPDTRFVVFSSNESGRDEVVVSTFPERRQTWPLTTDGGSPVSWSKDGHEILVATLNGHIVAYPVSTAGGNFSSSQPSTGDPPQRRLRGAMGDGDARSFAHPGPRAERRRQGSPRNPAAVWMGERPGQPRSALI